MIGNPDPIVMPLTVLLKQIQADTEEEVLDSCMRGVFERLASGQLKDDTANPRRGPHRNRTFSNKSHRRHDTADVEMAPSNFLLV